MTAAGPYVFRDIGALFEGDVEEMDHVLIERVCDKYAKRYAEDGPLQELVGYHIMRFLASPNAPEKQRVIERLAELAAERGGERRDATKGSGDRTFRVERAARRIQAYLPSAAI